MDDQWLWASGVAGAGLLSVLGVWVVRSWRVNQRLRLALKRAASIELTQVGSLLNSTELANLGSLSDPFRRMVQSIESQMRDVESRRSQLDDRIRLLETVFSAMVEGVIAVDSAERILFVNESALPLLDVKRDTIAGRLMLEVARNVSVHNVVREALAGRAEVPVELEVGRSAKCLRIVARRLPGEPCPGVVLIFHDVTDLRRLEAIRSEFVSNVSHELKTPLATISACAETLLDGALDDSANNRRFVERIEEQSQRLHELIVDLLRLANIEAQQNDVETEPVSVSAAVQRCVDDHRALVDDQTLRLEITSNPDDVHVLADDEGLRTILNNLVANAIKFTTQGSIRLGWQAEPSLVRISVEDTGIGIAQKSQARVFERFFRSDSARSRDAGGTGLGLAIVKHLVQSFGGQIELKSELGAGSRFTVILPRA